MFIVHQSLIDELQRIRSFFKIVDMEAAQLSTNRMNSSRLGVAVGIAVPAVSTMGRWTG